VVVTRWWSRYLTVKVTAALVEVALYERYLCRWLRRRWSFTGLMWTCRVAWELSHTLQMPST